MKGRVCDAGIGGTTGFNSTILLDTILGQSLPVLVAPVNLTSSLILVSRDHPLFHWTGVAAMASAVLALSLRCDAEWQLQPHYSRNICVGR